MTSVNNARINKALDRLEESKLGEYVWQTINLIDECTDDYVDREKRALVEDAHDLIADLLYLHTVDQDEWESLVQDRVDAARFVLRGRVEA